MNQTQLTYFILIFIIFLLIYLASFSETFSFLKKPLWGYKKTPEGYKDTSAEHPWAVLILYTIIFACSVFVGFLEYDHDKKITSSLWGTVIICVLCIYRIIEFLFISNNVDKK